MSAVSCKTVLKSFGTVLISDGNGLDAGSALHQNAQSGRAVVPAAV